MANKISLKCDACGKQLSVGADKAGKKVRCPCGQVVAVPKKASGEELARKWYYARQGERYGPVPQAELERLLAGGEVAADDYVWTRGMAAWKPANEVEQFAGVIAPPEAPPAEDVQAEPETSVAPVGADAPPQEAPPKPQPEPAKPPEPEPVEQAALPAKPSPPPAEAASPAPKPATPAARPAKATTKPPAPAARKPQLPPEAPGKPAPAPEAVAAVTSEEEATADHDEPEPQAPKARPVRQKPTAPRPAAQAPVAAIVVDDAPAYTAATALAVMLRVLGGVGFLGGAVWLVVELLRADTVSPRDGAHYLTFVVMMFGGLALVGVAQILALVRDAARDIRQMAGSVQEPGDRPRR